MRSYFENGKPERYDRVHLPAPCIPRVVLTAFRALAALNTVTTWIMCVVHDRGTMFLYYTQWGHTMTMITFLLLLVTSLTKRRSPNPFQEEESLASSDSLVRDSGDQVSRSSRSEGRLPVWKFALVLFSLTLTCEILITLAYWTMLYDPDEEMSQYETVINFFVHLVPTLLLLCEFALNSVVFKFSHGLWLLFIFVTYTITNLIGTKERGTPIYSILTWEDASTAVMLVGMLLGGAVVYLALFLITRIRERRYTKKHPEETGKRKGSIINGEVM